MEIRILVARFGAIWGLCTFKLAMAVAVVCFALQPSPVQAAGPAIGDQRDRRLHARHLDDWRSKLRQRAQL